MFPTSSLRPRTFACLRLCLTLTLIAILADHPSPRALADSVQPQLWMTNGSVSTLALANNKIYLGGTFSYVGPATGNLAAIDASSGAPDLSFPRVTGQVLAIAPDGSGGWFIGGSFTAVNGVPRPQLANRATIWQRSTPRSERFAIGTQAQADSC